MTSFKGRTKVGLTKPTQVRGTRDGSKFKIYAENDKISGGNGGVTSLRTSLPAKNGTQLAKSCGVKDLASNARNSGDSHDTLEKTKVARKALVDLSNLRGISSKLNKPGGYRKSVPSGTLTSTASSRQSITVKLKPKISHGVTTSHSTIKDTSKKSVRTSSNFNRVQPQQNAENKPRLYAQRKSYPILKRSSHAHANNSQGDGNSSNKPTRKFGFPMKTGAGAGGIVSSQASNKKSKALNDRRSNVVTVSKNRSSKDVPQKLRKSIKPVVSSSSQFLMSHKNSKSNSISSMDGPHVTISSREAQVAEGSVPMPNSTDSHEEVPDRESPAEDSGNVKAEMLEATAHKRSSRRKSYTSLLVSNSKLLGKKNELVELENLPNIDDQDNPLEVAEYVDDIYDYYWVMEAQSAPLENYMTIQTDVTHQMRGILINWLIEVHFKFDLMPETLYLTVALLDRYLSLVLINKKEMQLVGLASLLLASKYEDFWHPRVKDLISISAESYTRTQMLDTEKVILRKLKFRLNLPTAYVFMLRFLKASQSDEQLERLAFYLIELCLVDYEALKFKPSRLCASAVYVARCTLNKVPAWTTLLSKHARYEESQIRECAEMILRLHKAAKTGLLKVAYEKYKRPEFGGVATIKPLHALPL